MFVLLPLAMGMTVKRLSKPLGDILQKPIRALSIVGFVGMVLLVMLPHLDALVAVEGGGVLSTILMLTVAAWVIGWGSGGPDAGIRKVIVLGTSLPVP